MLMDEWDPRKQASCSVGARGCWSGRTPGSGSSLRRRGVRGRLPLHPRRQSRCCFLCCCCCSSCCAAH
eukprot:1157789-Pelagomonas_calceolata.AAC.6